MNFKKIVSINESFLAKFCTSTKILSWLQWIHTIFHIPICLTVFISKNIIAFNYPMLILMSKLISIINVTNVQTLINPKFLDANVIHIQKDKNGLACSQ